MYFKKMYLLPDLSCLKGSAIAQFVILKYNNATLSCVLPPET